MSAIEKAAAMLREEAEAIKASHTLRDDWCGDPAEVDYHEIIAAADAAIAERDELLEALKDMVGLVELMCPFDGPQQRKARAAIALATGESK